MVALGAPAHAVDRAARQGAPGLAIVARADAHRPMKRRLVGRDLHCRERLAAAHGRPPGLAWGRRRVGPDRHVGAHELGVLGHLVADHHATERKALLPVPDPQAQVARRVVGIVHRLVALESVRREAIDRGIFPENAPISPIRAHVDCHAGKELRCGRLHLDAVVHRGPSAEVERGPRVVTRLVGHIHEPRGAILDRATP